MNRFRHENPTEHDTRDVNAKCNIFVRDEIPADAQSATHKNKDRDVIDASIFNNTCAKNRRTGQIKITEEVIVTFMDELLMNNSESAFVPVMSDAVKKCFCEHCSESSCNHGGRGTGRIDPALKLHSNCPMMLTKNRDVANGEGNGSRVFVRNVNMKRGEKPFHLNLDNGSAILAAFASQVKHLVVIRENADIAPRTSEVEAETSSFQVLIGMGQLNDMVVSMKGTQFPVVSNSATAGHKLQGCTIDGVLVNDWHCSANWAHVVLSRVKKMSGLILRKHLTVDLSKCKKPQEMKRMLQRFKEKFEVQMLTQGNYKKLFLETKGVHYRPASTD